MSIGASHFDRITLIYGFAHFGKSLFWFTGELLFAYYLSEVAEIPPKYMGIVLALGYITGAVSDLVMGFLFSHKFSSPAATSKTQFLGAVFSAIALLLFLAGALVPHEYRLFYVFITGLLFRIAFTAYDLPQNSMISIGTCSDESRSNTAAIRIFFSGIASMLVAATAGPLIDANIPLDIAPRYLLMAIAWSSIGLGTSWLLRNIKWQPPIKQTEIINSKSDFIPFFLMILPLMALALVSAIFFPLFSKIEAYYTSYVLKSASWGGIIMIVTAFGTAISQPLWSKLAKSYSRKTLLLISSLSILLPVLLFGLFGLHPQIAMIGAFLFGFTNGGFGMASWAAYGDTVRHNASIAYSLFSVGSKIGAAIGIFIFGGYIAQIDYRGNESNLLLLAMCIFPAIGAILCALIIAFFVKNQKPKTAR